MPSYLLMTLPFGSFADPKSPYKILKSMMCAEIERLTNREIRNTSYQCLVSSSYAYSRITIEELCVDGAWLQIGSASSNLDEIIV